MEKKIPQGGIHQSKTKELKKIAIERSRQIWKNKYDAFGSGLSRESYCEDQSFNCREIESRKIFVHKESKIPILISQKPGQDLKRSIKTQPSISREILDPNLNFLADVESGVLHMYGTEAVKAAINEIWASNITGFIHTMSFHFVVFDNIIVCLERLKNKFPNIEAVSFECACLESLAQLNALGEIKGLKSLTIEEDGNPIMLLSLWKTYVVYRLSPTIEQINGSMVSESERCNAENIFGGIGFNAFLALPKYRLSSLLNSPKVKKMILKRNDFQDSVAKQTDTEKATNIMKATFMYSPDVKISSHGCKKIAKETVEKSIVNVHEAMKKRLAFKHVWPSMYSEIIKEALEDYNDIKQDMKMSMKNFQKAT